MTDEIPEPLTLKTRHKKAGNHRAQEVHLTPDFRVTVVQYASTTEQREVNIDVREGGRLMGVNVERDILGRFVLSTYDTVSNKWVAIPLGDAIKLLEKASE